jgi:hypothetical protein
MKTDPMEETNFDPRSMGTASKPFGAKALPRDNFAVPVAKLIICAAVALLCTGCAASFNPKPMTEVGVLERSQTQVEGKVRVTAAVPSAGETRDLFGASLYKRKVQPVWLEIENDRDETIWFLPVGLDPEYFTPIEAANLNLDEDSKESNDTMNRYFFDRGMSLYVDPGETRSGFMFTRLDEGTKSFNVDLISDDETLTFTFFIPVPGLKIDHYEVDWDGLYPEEEIVELDEAALIEALEAAPCCTTDKKAKGSGDPLNLVIIGDPDDVYYAFIRAGWDETETIHRGSAWKTAASFLSGGEYRYSPVSGLYVFGRRQDVALQKARDNIHERNHLRLWMSRARFRGKPVWLGQISRDIGVRFTWKTITTHKIDPDVDETREFLLEDLAYSQALAKFGYVGGVGAAPIDAPRGNLTGDPYFTDGYRLVLWVTSKPVSIADIGFLSWRTPPDRSE